MVDETFKGFPFSPLDISPDGEHSFRKLLAYFRIDVSQDLPKLGRTDFLSFRNSHSGKLVNIRGQKSPLRFQLFIPGYHGAIPNPLPFSV